MRNDPARTALLCIALIVATGMFGCAPGSDTPGSGEGSRREESEETVVQAAGRSVSQRDIRDLSEEIRAGRISLVSAAGNGNSSGASVVGTLLNKTAQAIHVGVNLLAPLYLSNSGASQNMIAAQVFLRDGEYFLDGGRRFITIEPNNVSVPVSFYAFCVDFDRDNPSAEAHFTTASPPPILTHVMANIQDSLIANPDRDITLAAQVAVWLAQGEAIETIRARFDFEPADESLARVLAFEPNDMEAALDRAFPQELAARGDVNGLYYLGRSYLAGEGVPQDDAEAVRWFRLAADGGHAAAQNWLGFLYSLGESVPRDYERAVHWYRLSAEQGHVNSQGRLGYMYEHAQGVSESVVFAYMWYNLAASQGDEWAQDAREDAEGRMTREQIAEAQRMSREWTEAHR